MNSWLPVKNLDKHLLKSGKRWLSRDEFTIAQAAGSVNGTPCDLDPANDTRYVSDTDTPPRLSVGSDEATYANPVLTASPYFFKNLAITREPGRIGIWYATAAYQSLTMGWRADKTGAPNLHMLVRSNDSKLYQSTTGSIQYAAGITGTALHFFSVLRATGAFQFCLLPGGYPILLYILTSSAASPLYQGFGPANYTYATPVAVGFMRIPTACWLPTPLISDGFGAAFDISDGLGHPEGIAGGLGAGGIGVVWTTVSGAWAVSLGKAVATTAGMAITPAFSTADFCVAVKVTMPSSGSTPGGLLVRAAAGAATHWYIKFWPGGAGPGGAYMELLDASGTQRAASTTALTAGTEYQIKITVRDANTWWRVWVNDSTRLSYTGGAGGNATEKIIGLKDEGNSNFKFDDLVVYAAGTGGEYSYLTRFKT